MARLNPELRSNESPMDYTYENGRGPVDEGSPFVQSTDNGLPYKDSFAGQKRSSDHFDSPKKQYFPGLRPPQGQRHLFTTASMKPVPFRKTSFTTPQNSIDAEFSSPLNPSSPMNADSEDTPEPQMPSAMQKSNGKIIPFEGNNSEKKHSSSNLFARSGRGEIATIKPYSNAGACKVDKRRRRLMDRDVRSAPRRSSNEWDSEERRSSSEGKSHKKESPTRQMSFIPSVLTFIDEHPGLPSTLSIYVQFLFNCFIALCLMYVLYGMFSTLRHDIDEKAMMESSEILAEMAVCAREFKENRCERESRVPAMETVCNSWEKCMARDPYMVGRSRLSAGMFAEIFNSFIEPISWKAILVSGSIIFGCFAINNLGFGLYRSWQHPPQQQTSHHQPTYMHPPPQHHMGYHPGNEQYYTPYQNHMAMQGMSQGAFRLEEQSPTKRLGYR